MFINVDNMIEDIVQVFHNTINDQRVQDNLKRKNIILNEIDFQILDVPYQVLASIKKNQDISPNFSLERASYFVKEILQYGTQIDDLNNRLSIAACDSGMPKSYSYLNENKKALSNLFPKYSSDDINKALTKGNNILLNAVSILKKNRKFKTKIAKKKTPISIIINDPLVSVQLDEIFRESEKERIQKEKVREERKLIRRATKDGSLFECECCICEYPIDWMLQCPEGHLICKMRVEKQIETTISEGKSNIKCLKFGGECECEISMTELERLIPKKTLERLVQTETLNAITTAEIKNTVKCHKCGFIVIFENRKDSPMICPQCKAQTCSKCGSEWHNGMTCKQFKAIDKERLVEEQMNEAVVRICPNCKTQFMKDEGCNRMECPRCHTWICYWCRKIIPKDVGYEHFWRKGGICPPNMCPLWVNNQTLHLIEAKNAKDKSKK